MVSTLLSQTVIEVELTVVEFTYWQLVTQEELDLWMKLGEEQAEHRNEPEVPKLVL